MTETAVAMVEPIEFTCTERDFLDAHRLHHTLTLKGRRFVIMMAVGTVAVGCASLFDREGINGFTLLKGLESAVVFFCAIAAMAALGHLLDLPHAARRQFSQHKEFRGNIKVGIDSPRIVLTTKNGFTQTPAEDFLKLAENRNCVLLYRSDRLFNLIPKRVIDEAFHQKLVAELTRAGVSKAGIWNS